MTLSQIYTTILHQLRKESKGLAVSPDAFTDLLRVENIALFNEEYRVFETTQEITDALRVFKSTDALSFSADGQTQSAKDSLVANYLHVTAIETTAGKKVDIVTEEEWVNRRLDAITLPTADYPIARIAGDSVYILPASITTATMYYLKSPTAPFFDYYFDANLNIVGLSVGQSYTLQAGEVYRDGTTSGSKTSTTVELEWEEPEQIKILQRILAKLGVSMDEQLVAQLAMANKNE